MLRSLARYSAMGLYSLLLYLLVIEGTTTTQLESHEDNVSYHHTPDGAADPVAGYGPLQDSQRPEIYSIREHYPDAAINTKTVNNTTNCPTWFYPNPLSDGSTGCECGSALGNRIKCSDGQSSPVYLLRCYSMTYNADTVVGAALYGCRFILNSHYSLPSNPSDLKQLCEYYNRDGQLCGKCREGFAPPVYSYSMNCVNCTDYANNWMKYVAVAFLPLTAFFVLVITFRVSATSGLLNTFILISQTVTIPIEMRALMITNPWPIFFLSSLYGMWNLDFFRSLYPLFYLNCEMTTIQVLTLDYAVAIYPLVLITLTYILVELYDHNFKIITWFWKPVCKCFARFRREWNIKASLVDAFATFLLLSYVKFLGVSFDLLVPTRVFNIHGESRLYLYYDGSLEYFGKEHLPYGILALLVLSVFNIFPLLLLLLYPCRCFQRCLNCCKLRCQLLHTFMDAFQGHYKDGTNGTRDCRWFAALYLIVRIAFMISITILIYSTFWLIIGASMIIVMLFLTAIFRPYKLPMYNNIDIFLLTVFALIFVAVIAVALTDFSILSNVMLGILTLTTLAYLIGLILYKLFGSIRCVQTLCQKILAAVSCNYHKEEEPNFDEILPYRVDHNDETEYTPLLL